MIYLPRSKIVRPPPRLDRSRNPSNYGNISHVWHGGLLTPTTLYDLSPSAPINGTPGSGMVIDSGRFGNTMKLGGTGNDYIDLGTEILQGQLDWTFSLWFYLNPSGALPLIFYGETNSSAAITHYHGVKAGNVAYFGLFNGSGFSESVGTLTINTGEWYHYCATFSTTLGGMKSYVNGQLDGSNANVSYITGGTHADLGAVYQTPTGRILNWYGYLDLVSIWSRCFLPSEVSWLYQNPMAIFGNRRRRNSFTGANLLAGSFVPCVD